MSTTNTESVALGLEIGGEVVEEPARDRDQSLVSAFALGEHPPFRGLQIL